MKSPEDSGILDFIHLDEIRAMPGRQGGSLLDEFVALFLREEPPRLDQLRALAAAGPSEELVRLSHTLAGSCAMLGATDMQRAALRLQAAGRAGTAGEISGRLAEVDSAWQRLQEALARNGMMPR